MTTKVSKLLDMTGEKIATRARRARLRAGYDKPGDAAKAIGCSRTLILRWESGSARSIGKFLLPAARAYDVKPAWLALEADDDGYPVSDKVRIVSADEIAPGYVRVPQLDLPAGAGPGDEMDTEPEIVRWLDVAKAWADQHFPRHLQHIRVLTARGDSMVGAGIQDGDLLFVDTGITRYDGDGNYVLRFRDGWQVKRLRADMLSQRLEVVSMLESREESRTVMPEQETNLSIGGKVSAWWTLRR